MAVQPPATLDYSTNSYFSYSSTSPLPDYVQAAAPITIQLAGNVGSLSNSHVVCVPNHPTADSPSDQVLAVSRLVLQNKGVSDVCLGLLCSRQQVKRWLEQQEGVDDVQYLAVKKRVKRGGEL